MPSLLKPFVAKERKTDCLDFMNPTKSRSEAEKSAMFTIFGFAEDKAKSIIRAKYIAMKNGVEGGRKILKYPLVAVLLVMFLAGLTACKDEEDEPQKEGEIFYIVGYAFSCPLDTANGVGKAHQYLLISEKCKNVLDYADENFFNSSSFNYIFMATENLPDTLFTFSSEILYPSEFIRGYNLFPEECRFDYKVRMTYRMMTQEEWNNRPYSCPWPYIGTTQHSIYYIQNKGKEEMLVIESISRSE